MIFQFVWITIGVILGLAVCGDATSNYTITTSTRSIGTGGILPVLSYFSLDCSSSYNVLNRIKFQKSLDSGVFVGSYLYTCWDVGTATYMGTSSSVTPTVCHGNDLTNGGLIQLMDHDIDCGGIGLIMQLKFSYWDQCCPNYCQRYEYQCGNFGPLTCRDVVNPATTIGSTSTQNVLFLNLQDIACNATEGIGHIHYESYGSTGWYHYTCCSVTPNAVAPSLAMTTTRYFNSDPGGIVPTLANYALDCSANQRVLNQLAFRGSAHSSHLSAFTYGCQDVDNTYFLASSSLVTSSVCHGNDMSGGLNQLMDHDIDCGANSMLTRLQFTYWDQCCPNYCQRYSYQCATYSGLTCRDVVNPATTLGPTTTQNVLYLYLQDIACNATEGIGHIHYESYGSTGWYHYTCCSVTPNAVAPSLAMTTTRYYNSDPGGVMTALTPYSLDCRANQAVLNQITFQPSVRSNHLSAYLYGCQDVGDTYYLGSSSLATSERCYGNDLSGGLNHLTSHVINCGSSGMLMRMQFILADHCCPNYCDHYDYTCGTYTTLSCRVVVNPATTIGTSSTYNVLFLYTQKIACLNGEGIGKINYYVVGTTGYYNYTCCTPENPTTKPTASPTLLPTAPTMAPTVFPTIFPTACPTFIPSRIPTCSPTCKPTVEPTLLPTQSPTVPPTPSPTTLPTFVPTADPTPFPTSSAPTVVPTRQPSPEPTARPTAIPTVPPTPRPSAIPTMEPTPIPTISFRPTSFPTTSSPTNASPNAQALSLNLIIVSAVGAFALLTCVFAVYAYSKFVYGKDRSKEKDKDYTQMEMDVEENIVKEAPPADTATVSINRIIDDKPTDSFQMNGPLCSLFDSLPAPTTMQAAASRLLNEVDL